MRLERTTLRDPRVGKALRGFLTVRYVEGYEHADSAIARFGVSAYPTLLVVSASGVELDEVWGADPQALVESLERVKRGEDTLPALHRRIAASPDDFEAIADLAGRLEWRRPWRAEILAKGALARIPDANREEKGSLLLTLASIRGMRGDGEGALSALERVLSECAGATCTRGVAPTLANYDHIVDPTRGLAVLDRARASLEPPMRNAFEGSRGVLLRRAWEASIRQETLRYADEPELLNMQAWTCYQRGLLTEEATAWAEKAVKLSDRAPHILDTLARLYFRQDRIDEALKLEAEALMKVDPDHPGRREYEEAFATFRAVKRVRLRREAKAE